MQNRATEGANGDPAPVAEGGRPLAPRGRRASKVIAEHLRREQITRAVVLCSSATRARETLDVIAGGFGKEARVQFEIEARLHAASAGDLLARLRQVQGDIESVMLTGHDPAIRELALSLASGGRRLEELGEKFPTAALATLSFRGPRRSLAPGAEELVAYVKPRELESPSWDTRKR